MYAVIETGGKQYRVELGTELAVERLPGNAGDSIEFDRVLLVADGEATHVGTPTVAQAMVTAQVVRQDRGEKLIVFKYRPKARHRAKKGHRQELTVLRVADIRLDGRSAAQEAGSLAKEQAKAQQAAKADAERKAAADKALAEKLASAAREEPAEATPAAKPRRRAAKATAGGRAQPADTSAEESTDAEAAPVTKKKSAPAAKSSARTKTSAGATKTPATRGKKNTKKES